MQTKGKNRINGKLGKLFTSNTNSMSHPDLSSLRKPIDTSVSDLYQVSKLLEDGTDEVKAILSYECSIIYECCVCRSLFRSIVNLISHKREYCKEKFDITLRKRVLNSCNVHSTRKSIMHMFKAQQTSNKEGVKNDRILRSQVSKGSSKRDLSAIIDVINKKQEEYIEKQIKNENAISQSPDDHVHLETTDTNCSAIYQTVKSSNAVVDAIDLMKKQITELKNMTDENTFALDGQMSENQLSEKSDSPIQANMSDEDEENELLIYRLPKNNLFCFFCNAKFSTKKTLTVHIKTQHTFKRLCYPCPCCTNTFANTWSVYRHLYKVHKMTNKQVCKLKLQIKQKAFHRKSTVMRHIKKVHADKVSALKNAKKNSNKTREPISHTESNTKLCDKRKRKLNMKTSCIQYYQTPIAARDEIIKSQQCNEFLASISNNMKCEVDVDLATDTIIKPSNNTNISNENSEYVTSSSEISNHELPIQAHFKINKEDWDLPENEDNYLSEHNSSVDSNNDSDVTLLRNIDNIDSLSSTESQDSFASDENSKSSKVVCADVNEVNPAISEVNKKEEASSQLNEKQETDSKEGENIEVKENNFNMQSSSLLPNEKNWVLLMESKLASIANFEKRRCLLCKRKFTSIANVRRHVAVHLGWNRYRCKLCDFKCFIKCECITHCIKMHNIQNRTAAAEMIFEIPQNEYMCNDGKDVITEATDLDITNATVSPCQLEMCVDLNSSNNLDIHATLQNEATAPNEQVAESFESAEYQSVDVDENDKIVTMPDLPECMLNSKKLDDDLELKRMVMEVIFGSNDVNATEQVDSESTLETNDYASEHIDANANVNNVTTINESKEASCLILENVKQRPTRNRIKPLNKDFVYDLKEVVHRKETALINNSEILHIRKKVKL
ncbi:zinc finger protein 800 [Monomorium pharaonis]|uniref:zinc finger protein 800 n=1 Tax=Monomorium pharaonis TaxID=307658 RepID=UPI00063F6DD7|nr:zinc finger protein 800 [Monomorium pharaonis]